VSIEVLWNFGRGTVASFIKKRENDLLPQERRKQRSKATGCPHKKKREKRNQTRLRKGKERRLEFCLFNFFPAESVKKGRRRHNGI